MEKDRIKKLDELFEAFSIISEGNYVYICDMAEDYSRWSKNAIDYFDLPGEYMYKAGEIWEKHIHPEDRKSYNQSISDIFSGKDNGHHMQYRAKSRNGEYAFCTCKGVVLKDIDGKPEYFAGSIKNHGVLSYMDNITGLRSLYGFLDDANSIFWRKEDNIILLIGITNFSRINDIYGYSFGNKALCAFAAMLSKIFQNKGYLYRMEGTKFALITNQLTISQISEIYSKIKKRSVHYFSVDDKKLTLSLSAGVIAADNFEIDSETVYSCLKYSYYESKNKNLGELVVFENETGNDNRQLVEKINVIRNCVADNCKGFFLCYQPIINAETEELKGMEALLRWQNDFYGVVPPVQFIEILEQDPLFPELGKWILTRSMLDGKKMIGKYPDFLMNINLSYAQLENRNFLSELFAILKATEYPPTNLCLEITERCRLLDLEMLKDIFKIIREKGIKVALDDFGTGFSSLGILRELPVDIVKIDREYVKNIEKSSSDQNTVKFIADLAAAFTADVCVEGVETAEMRDFILKYQVGCLQGYYYSKPITIEKFADKYLNQETN